MFISIITKQGKIIKSYSNLYILDSSMFDYISIPSNFINFFPSFQ